MESQNKISYQPNICIIGFNGNNVNNIIDGYGLFFEIIKENLWFAIERMFFPLVNEEEFIEKV
ncbi:MAG: hypothetical protein UR82_C0051G0005 [Candidatus Moranbacteria bacterium GW2011_GWF1_35_5]|nr:MAG: hypothetical protein UR82_C0051G0005 [Candidatus Moranbacteria bacterium GW2011_GWF1_35_5]